MLTGSKIGDSLPGPDSLALAQPDMKHDVSVHKSVCVCERRDVAAAAATTTLQTLTEDRKSSRCLRTSSTTPGRRVRTETVHRVWTSYGHKLDAYVSSPGSERVLGDHPADRSIRALRIERQLLAESGKRRPNLEGFQDQKEHPGVALQAPSEIRPRPGESQAEFRTDNFTLLKPQTNKTSDFIPLIFHTSQVQEEDVVLNLATHCVIRVEDHNILGALGASV